MPYYLALKAEVLHLADRTSEALEALNEAEALAHGDGGETEDDYRGAPYIGGKMQGIGFERFALI